MMVGYEKTFFSQNVGWASIFLPTVTDDGGQEKDLAHPTKNHFLV